MAIKLSREMRRVAGSIPALLAELRQHGFEVKQCWPVRNGVATLHLIISDHDGKRLLDFYPASRRWVAAQSADKGHVALGSVVALAEQVRSHLPRGR